MKYCKKLTCQLLALCAAVSALSIGGGSVSADSDKNIVAGLPYTVETGVGIEYSYGLSGGETPASEGKLTDGKRATTNAYDDVAWNKFYRGYKRFITFELPEPTAITGFSMSLIQCSPAGLPMPPEIEIYVSENGTDYMLAISKDNSALMGVTSPTLRTIKVTGEGPFLAKYVRVAFRCEVSVYTDEIEIYGHKPDGNEKPFVKYEEREYVNKYDEGVDGCKEMVLLYCGYKGKYTEEYVNNTEERLLPYFGHINKDGEIDDTFFDSFLFSQLGGIGPTGGSLDPNTKIQATTEDWEYFLNSIFDEEYNCGAIESAMDKVKAATGQTDAKVSLVISLPYPHMGSKAFGDINGDGKKEYCRTVEDQYAIYEWFFDLVEAKLAERNYKNIAFGGYYWVMEGIQAETEKKEIEFVHHLSESIHNRGSKLFWIPYLYGNCFDRVDQLGFDCAMMQPNFSFLPYAKEKCFDEINESIQKYGLGIEIEVKWGAITDDVDLKRYYTYLNAGHALGYEYNVAHSYYQNANPGTYYLFYISSNPKYRNAYDDTYLFVKGKYQPREVILLSQDKSVKQGKSVRGAINIKSDTFAASLGEWAWNISAQPAHGKVTITENGIYTYVPEEGFTGVDAFTVCLKAEYAESNPITINIEIVPNEDEASSEPEVSEEVSEEAVVSEVSEPTSEEPKAKKNVAPFVAAGAAAVAVAGAVAAAVVAKKKKNNK